MTKEPEKGFKDLLQEFGLATHNKYVVEFYRWCLILLSTIAVVVMMAIVGAVVSAIWFLGAVLPMWAFGSLTVLVLLAAVRFFAHDILR